MTGGIRDMGIQIGAKPDSGFDDPIGMLADCHRRIEHFLNILCVVVERARSRALSGEETAAIEASIHYFQVGGKRHNADEEESLFPRLRREASSGSRKDLIGALTGDLMGLEHDHQAADSLHATADALYRKWISSGELTEGEHSELRSSTLQLQQLYKEHIQLEERVVFPMAAQLFDRDTVLTIGEEFRLRRA
jgi:hemerythrin-like domain-containing protein